MKKQMIITVLIVCLMNLMFVGCGDEGKSIQPDVSIASNHNSANDLVFTPDDSEENSGIISGELRTFSDGGQGDILQALASSEVQYIISHFADKGYEYSPVNSFVITGSAVPEGHSDTVEAKITNIILRYAPDESQSYIHISYIISTNMPELPVLISTSLTSFVEPGNDIESYEYYGLGMDDGGVERGLWVTDYISPFSTKGENNSIALFDMREYRNCVLKGFISGCAATAIVCLAGGPGYPACVATGCTGAYFAAGIYCALDQWF